jgi:hypothetical protein
LTVDARNFLNPTDPPLAIVLYNGCKSLIHVVTSDDNSTPVTDLNTEKPNEIAQARREASTAVMGWTPPAVCAASWCQAETWAWVSVTRQEESKMNATTVAVDLAKNVFEVAVADRNWKVIERARLTRSQFER